MRSRFRIAFLSSVITAALVYVAIEWQPLTPSLERSPEGSIFPEISFAAPPSRRALQPAVPGPGALREIPLTTDEENNIDVYRRFSRSVVNITSTTITYDFFLQAVPASGSGSGVIIDDEGHIVTNYHVVRSPRADLEVTLSDQSRHPARLVGVDPNNDLAVIRIDADADWTPVPMGTIDGLQVGQKVLAIGNPFGLDRTLTTGIISSLGRSIRAPVERQPVVIEGVIQTDAAINQGNSGGPLLNTQGEIIGINTAIVSGATGIGFAIPVDTVRRVVNDLIRYGRVRRVYLGIRGESLANLGPLVEVLELGSDYGVLIGETIPGGPAADAGLRGADRRVRVVNYIVETGGDVIISVDGRTVRTMTDIRTALEPHRPGDQVEVTIVREGEQMDVVVTLEEEPSIR